MIKGIAILVTIVAVSFLFSIDVDKAMKVGAGCNGLSSVGK